VTPTHKWQKTAKDEEVPNSLLSLPEDILDYCFSFVGDNRNLSTSD
jgi:hypothetical protein